MHVDGDEEATARASDLVSALSSVALPVHAVVGGKVFQLVSGEAAPCAAAPL